MNVPKSRELHVMQAKVASLVKAAGHTVLCIGDGEPVTHATLMLPGLPSLACKTYSTDNPS